jgi:hypothetical protein
MYAALTVPKAPKKPSSTPTTRSQG